MTLKDLSDDQACHIAKLALSSIVNFDFVYSKLHGQRDVEYYLAVKREIYDKKENLQVVRVYIDGMPGCYCSIWEEDLDVNTYENEQCTETMNQVKIFQYMQSIGLTTNPPK